MLSCLLTQLHGLMIAGTLRMITLFLSKIAEETQQINHHGHSTASNLDDIVSHAVTT